MTITQRKFSSLCESGEIVLDEALSAHIQILSHDRTLNCFSYHGHGYVLRTESLPQSRLKVVPHEQYHIRIEGFAFLTRLRSVGINTPVSLFARLHTTTPRDYTEEWLKNIYDEGPSFTNSAFVKKGADCKFTKQIWKYRFKIFTENNHSVDFFIAHALIKKQASAKLKKLPISFAQGTPTYTESVSGDLLLDMYDAMTNPTIRL